MFLTGSYPVFEMRLDPDPGKTHSDYLIFFYNSIDSLYLQHKFWFGRSGVSVVAVAPYYIDTPFLGDWGEWTPDPKVLLLLPII